MFCRFLDVQVKELERATEVSYLAQAFLHVLLLECGAEQP